MGTAEALEATWTPAKGPSGDSARSWTASLNLSSRRFSLDFFPFSSRDLKKESNVVLIEKPNKDKLYFPNLSQLRVYNSEDKEGGEGRRPDHTLGHRRIPQWSKLISIAMRQEEGGGDL